MAGSERQNQYRDRLRSDAVVAAAQIGVMTHLRPLTAAERNLLAERVVKDVKAQRGKSSSK